ncbi:hypothetical protein SCALM49S_10179 [Streptomyces californicus]
MIALSAMGSAILPKSGDQVVPSRARWPSKRSVIMAMAKAAQATERQAGSYPP